MGVSMSLSLKDGKTILQIEAMEIETKAEAVQAAQMLTQWAESLPEKKARTRGKRTSSRRTATAKPRSRSRNGEAAPAETAEA
jgi:hypothetical protein